MSMLTGKDLYEAWRSAERNVIGGRAPVDWDEGAHVYGFTFQATWNLAAEKLNEHLRAR